MPHCKTEIVRVPYAFLRLLLFGVAEPDTQAVERVIISRQAEGWTLLSRREEAPKSLDHVRYRDCRTVLVFRRCDSEMPGRGV